MESGKFSMTGRGRVGIVKRACAVLGMGMAGVLIIFLILMLVALIRAFTIQSEDYHEPSSDVKYEELPQSYLDTLPQLMARSLKIPTVSTDLHVYDTEALLRFHTFLRESFPGVFSSSFIDVQEVNTYSFLFNITGTDTSLQPYLLASHMDVVPVANEEMWTVDPFAGIIQADPDTGEEFIWGRGAIDDKLGVMSIMMALEYLVTSGFQPNRSFYVAFGHDEEVHGVDGAGHIAELLKSRNVSLEFVFDEGMPVLDGVMKGVTVPVAAIGVTEKGFMQVKLEVTGEGGHSSMPPKDQAVTRLVAAVHKIQTHPQPAMFAQSQNDLFTMLAPKTSWPYRLIFANMWLFKPLMPWVMSRERETDALIRTTTATTVLQAGIKENVVPSSGWASINHRVHPEDNLDQVLAHDMAVINDPLVKLTVLEQREAAPISPYGPEVGPWRLLANTIQKVFPGIPIVPTTLVGNTDTRFYLDLSECVYRFFPVVLRKDDIKRIHGLDERISTHNLLRAVTFYHALMRRTDQDGPLVVRGRNKLDL